MMMQFLNQKDYGIKDKIFLIFSQKINTDKQQSPLIKNTNRLALEKRLRLLKFGELKNVHKAFYEREKNNSAVAINAKETL
jgi:hypothetical protein